MPAVNAVTSEKTSSNSWVEIARYEDEFSRARLEPAEGGRRDLDVAEMQGEDEGHDAHGEHLSEQPHRPHRARGHSVEPALHRAHDRVRVG